MTYHSLIFFMIKRRTEFLADHQHESIVPITVHWFTFPLLKPLHLVPFAFCLFLSVHHWRVLAGMLIGTVNGWSRTGKCKSVIIHFIVSSLQKGLSITVACRLYQPLPSINNNCNDSMETFRLKVPSGKRITSEEKITNNKYPLWHRRQLICWITVDKNPLEKTS